MNREKMFNRYVSVVEIENTSFCNRTCSFCSNAHIDRHSQHHVMDKGIYTRFLLNLKEAGYAGVLNFNRYNEPFAEKIILERITLAHNILGDKVTLMCFSNADYLNEEYMSQIMESGLNILYLQEYSDETNKDRIIHKLIEIKEKLGNFEYELRCSENMIECKLLNTMMREVCIQHRFFEKCGNPRGGTVSQFKKTVCEGSCYSPTFTIVIDYNGNVMPCCHLRSDCEEHKDYIIGNISEDNIVNIYFSDAAMKFRNDLLLGKRPAVCMFCHDSKKDWKR